MSELKRPFSPDNIMWKPGHTTKDRTKCQAMAYGDLRAYMERLDEVCGTSWSVTYQPWGSERIIAHLTIDGVTRSSVGEMTSQDVSNGIGGTVAEAQAFKRAAAMFGLGRYLYSLPAVWVPYDESKRRITDEGQKQLQQRYEAYYQKWLAKHSSSQPQVPVSEPGPQSQPATNGNGHAPEPDNPFDDEAGEAGQYAALIDRLEGDCRKRANWTRRVEHGDESGGPCTEKMYQYLAGILNGITETEGSHRAILEVLTGKLVTHENRPCYNVVSRLLDVLPEQVRDKNTGEMVDNPNHQPDAVNCMRRIWELCREADGQLTMELEEETA